MNRVRVGRWMLMPDGIQRYNMFCSPDDRYVNPGGEWVRFTDVQARLGEKSGEIDRLSEELDQANTRTRELETQLVYTERRRAAAIEQAEQLRAGMRQAMLTTPAPDEESS